ncbi:putative F-box protein [Cinnamomum micranthum f. kanehirae]|uniref:Putative F-box protein n=1 Tax=Cinnamomum micranthum f. kanehirae TaxID=337451 RepID=A0A3S4PTL9_9MAGN|nr:putative F-box protein [Cinnamomum micranthum f. kanehirae]
MQFISEVRIGLISMDKKQLEELALDEDVLYQIFNQCSLRETIRMGASSMDKKQLEELALDEDVMYRIFNQCSLRDTIRMGAVCKSWLSVSRWSTRARPQLPWLMMLPNSDSRAEEKEDDHPQSLQKQEGEFRSFFNLSENTLYDPVKFPELVGKRCCVSFNNADACGWIMTIVNHYLEMQLFHPWRRIQLQLPNYSTLPPGNAYPPSYFSVSYFQHDHRIFKAAMSDDAAVVMVINERSSKLAFCRIGDNVWTHVSSSTREAYFDVIYYNGQFYAIAFRGRLGVVHIDTTHPYVEILTELIIVDRFYPYLVADSASKSLFIVLRSCAENRIQQYPHISMSFITTSDFKVFEIGLEETGDYKKNPVELESLGDRVIFLGRNPSMIFLASQFRGLEGNRIYFTDDRMERFGHEIPLKFVDVGIFNMEDKSVQKLFLTKACHSSSPPIWVMPPCPAV